MTSATTIKQNDTSPPFTAACQDNLGNVAELGGASVQFFMRNKRTHEVVVDAAATIVNAGAGTVSYQWALGDTATPGRYAVEFEATFPDGTVETFPSNGHHEVEIVSEIATGRDLSAIVNDTASASDSAAPEVIPTTVAMILGAALRSSWDGDDDDSRTYGTAPVIEGWADGSANGYDWDVSANAVNTRPSEVVDGHNGLSFIRWAGAHKLDDGAVNWPLLGGATGWDLWIVVRKTGSDLNDNGILKGAAPGENPSIFLDFLHRPGDLFQFDLRLNDDNWGETHVWSSDYAPDVMRLVHIWTDATTLYMQIDGDAAASNPLTETSWANAMNLAALGDYNGAGSHIDIGEIAASDGSSATQRAAVSALLQSKWSTP